MSRIVVIAGLAALAVPSLAAAQTLGTFQWRLAPYCNTLVLTVIQEGSQYRLQGYEDFCDHIYYPQPVSGTAIAASDGSIIIGLTTSASGGFSVKGTRVTAQIVLPSLNGNWSDDAGRRGQFVSVASPTVGGTQRGSAPLAFLHIVSSQNRRAGAGDNVSCFSHPLTDGNPDVLMSVTSNRGQPPLRPFVQSTVSLYLHTGLTGLPGDLAGDVWCISRNDSQQMPLGAGFTIQILSP
jgi:hypothetical protein